MNNIKLLDCTLRDGGYVNDWNFGKDAIIDIKKELDKSGTEIIELGFIRDEDKNEDRSIFTSIDEVKKLIKNKLPNREYAVMTEVSNPFPLDKLEPYSEGAPDIIRVIVWKRMLKEGYEYCKGIVEKGYKLCVQPARVSQYSDEEFIEMLNLFSSLNPMAIYVVDSWGTMYKDELLHYLNLANSNLKSEIAVGYHGHNNLMQAFEVACSFCEQNLARDLIIDSSVYGIGRGAGNLNSELIAKWMNEKINKNYNLDTFTKIFDKYISKIYLQEKWGYSVPFEITAKYNCNPNYASFYEKLGVSNEMIEQAIKQITPEERIIFTEKKAQEAMRIANKNKWHHKVVVVVVTANRPKAITGYLNATLDDLYNYGIDLIIYDSTSNDEVKNLINIYKNKYDNLIYDRWNGVYDGISIDSKVIDAYEKYSSKYDYVWITREGTPINVKEVIPNIEKYLFNNNNLVVVDSIWRDWKRHGNKTYIDPVELFKEQTHQMTVLGATIVKSDDIREMLEEVPLNKETNYGIWQPIAILNHFARKDFIASSWVGNLWLPNECANPSSHWHNKTLWQWGERWYKSIMALPSVYDIYKNEVLRFELIDCQPFDEMFIAKSRKLDGISISKILKYKKYLQKTTKTPLWKFYVISIAPKFLAKVIAKFIKKIDIKYNYNLPKTAKSKGEIINYEQNKNCFELTKNIKSNLLFGSQDNVENPLITVFIPTYKRLNLLKESIDSVLNQQMVDFEWNLIIVDNEPYNGHANSTEKYVKALNDKRITYYRNDKNLRVGDNFNRGFTLAKAPWVVMLHDDDLLLPNALSKIGKSIEYLSAIDKKELGAIAMIPHQFFYNPQRPDDNERTIKHLKENYKAKPMLYKYYKLTHSNVLLNGHIGGAVPTCGATYNKKAVLEVGGFNEDFGISADLILYYCLENKYSVYSALEPYGLYRLGQNQMTKKESAYNTIKDNFDFREYVFSKNIFTKLYGLMFRSSLYYAFTKTVLNMRKVATADSVEFYDYADIYNKKPNIISYIIYKNVIKKIYGWRKSAQKRITKQKIKAYIKKKEQKELADATNK